MTTDRTRLLFLSVIVLLLTSPAFADCVGNGCSRVDSSPAITQTTPPAHTVILMTKTYGGTVSVSRGYNLPKSDCGKLQHSCENGRPAFGTYAKEQVLLFLIGSVIGSVIGIAISIWAWNRNR